MKAKEAAVINKKQKSKTLSAQSNKKVNKQKWSVRATLANNIPRTNFQGYTLSEGDCLQFEVKLTQIFQNTPPVKQNWSVLKSYSKEERRALRKSENIVSPLRAYVALGFNETTRAMETRTATAIILSDDINPKQLTEHFHQCCDIYKIPLLKVKNLRSILKDCFGFSSIAMALKDSPKELPIYHFYMYLTSFPNHWSSTIMNMIQESDEKLVETKSVHGKNGNEQVVEKRENGQESKDVYLYRDSKEKRCFVPAPSKKKVKTFEADFVAFNAEPAENDEFPFGIQNQQKPITMLMKKIQANSKRVKNRNKIHKK